MDIKKSLEIIVLDLLHLITTFKLKYLALLAISDLVIAIILDNHQVTFEFRQNKSIVSLKQVKNYNEISTNDLIKTKDPSKGI
jgi:hypothetical protein